MKTRTALVFGATGLVGSALIQELCRSENYDTVRIFVRKETDFVSEGKIKETITDFEHLRNYSEMIKGDDLFICLGTTIKKAGTVKRMEEIDRDLPLEIASIASENSVGKMAVVSSLGANPGSSNYYLRIKGEMEREMMKIKFKTLIILRPSLLLGKRTEKRRGEMAGKIFMGITGIFLVGKLSRYRGIEARMVAGAMVKAINDKTGTEILESEVIRKISGF